jgi:hypothetical protein
VRRSLPVSGSYVVDGLAATAVLLAVATVIGLAALWPHGKLGPVATLGAVAKTVTTRSCRLSASHRCRVATVELLNGPQKGQLSSLTTVAAVGALDVQPGDHIRDIRVYRNAIPPGSKNVEQSFADFDRRGPMLWLAIGFAVLLVATGRFHGCARWSRSSRALRS